MKIQQLKKLSVLCMLLMAVSLSAQAQFAHIILIVQENRTPDNLFSACNVPGADVIAVGNPAPLGHALIDLPHTHAAYVNELAGQYPPLAKGYVRAQDINPYCQIAIQYGFANRMFQTNQGPSGPAHDFLFGGTSAPVFPGQLHDDWMRSENGGNCLSKASMSTRSEERRVGKECRSRWSPYH